VKKDIKIENTKAENHAELYKLIQTLSNAERNDIKNSFNKSTDGLRKMFNVYAKSEVLPNRSRFEKIKNAENRRKELIDKILKILNKRELKKDIDFRIVSLILDAKILFKRGLLIHSNRKLKKAKTLAKEFNSIGLLIIINSWEKMIFNGKNIIDDQIDPRINKSELDDYIVRLKLKKKLSDIRSKQSELRIISKDYWKRPEREELMLDADKLFEKGRLDLSSKLEYIYCKQNYFHPIIHKEEYRQVVNEIITFHQNNTVFSEYNYVFKLQSLLNKSYFLAINREIDEFKQIRAEIENLPTNKAERVYTFKYTMASDLACLVYGGVDKINALIVIDGIAEKYQKYQNIIEVKIREDIIGNLLELYFIYEEYDKAKGMLLLAEKTERYKNKWRTTLDVEIFKMMLQYEFTYGYSTFEDYTNNSLRKIRNKEHDDLDKSFIDFMERICRAEKTIKIEFENYQVEIEEMKKDKGIHELRLPIDFWVKNNLKKLK